MLCLVAESNANPFPVASHDTTKLPLCLESVGEALHVVLQVAVVGKELNVGTVDLDAASSNRLQVLLAAEGSETPVLGDDDLLATRELVLRAAESLKSDSAVWRIRLESRYMTRRGIKACHWPV